MAAKKLKLKDFKPVIVDGKHCIKVGNDFLKTPRGLVIEAPSAALCERIKADFEGQGDIIVEKGRVRKPMVFSAYVLASTKRDFMDNGGDLSEDVPGWLASDPIFSPTAGHPVVSMFQVEQQSFVEKFLLEQNLQLKVWQSYSSEEKTSLVSIIQQIIAGFSPVHKSALVNMSWPIGKHFVATIMFLIGRCNSREWASLVFSRTPDVVRIIGDEAIGGFMSIPDNVSQAERNIIIKGLIGKYEDICRIANLYFEADK